MSNQQPPAGHGGSPVQAPAPRHPQAVLSLVLGIASFLCCLTGIPAIVVGRRAVKQIDASGGAIGGRGAAEAGWITGLVGTLLIGIPQVLVVFVFLFGGALTGVFTDTCSSVSSSATTTSC